MKKFIALAALATLALADKDKQPFGKLFESIDKAGKGLVNGLNNLGKALEHPFDRKSTHADDFEDEEFVVANLADKLKELEKIIYRHPELLKKIPTKMDDAEDEELVLVSLADRLRELEKVILRHPELLSKYPTSKVLLDETDDELALLFKLREIQNPVKPSVLVATRGFLGKDLAVEAVQPELNSLRKVITFEDDSLSFLEKLLKLDDEVKNHHHSQQGQQGPKNSGRGKINF